MTVEQTAEAACSEVRMNWPNRVFFSLLLAGLFSGVPLHSPTSAGHPGITHTLLFNGKVPGTEEQVIVWDTEYAPGAVNPRHFHPAAVTFRLLSGTDIWQQAAQPPVALAAAPTLPASPARIHAHPNPRT